MSEPLLHGGDSRRPTRSGDDGRSRDTRGKRAETRSQAKGSEWHAACSIVKRTEHRTFQSGKRRVWSGCNMFSTRVRMTVEWYVPLGQTRPITMALHSVAAETRALRGCVGCSVSTDIGNRGIVRYTEEWQTEDDMRMRVRSDTFAHLVALVEDATEPPRIEFTTANGTRGLDFVEEVRASIP